MEGIPALYYAGIGTSDSCGAFGQVGGEATPFV